MPSLFLLLSIYLCHLFAVINTIAITCMFSLILLLSLVLLVSLIPLCYRSYNYYRHITISADVAITIFIAAEDALCIHTINNSFNITIPLCYNVNTLQHDQLTGFGSKPQVPYI